MKPNIDKIGIVGAGQMGNGIAQVCAKAKFQVHLLDLDSKILELSNDKINRSLDREIDRGQLDALEKKEIVSRISTSTDFKDFTDCDLVIEAATENETVKIEIINKLCSILNKDSIIASNTSSISITRLAARSDRPR